MKSKSKYIIFSFFSILLFGCREPEFRDHRIHIIDSYVFTSIEYPELHTSLLNSYPYIFNDGGYIEELGSIINKSIDFNKPQSDSTTLLVYRHDIDYTLQNTRIDVYKQPDGNIKIKLLYEIIKNSNISENRYTNVICIKVPKINNLNTFSCDYALQVIN